MVHGRFSRINIVMTNAHDPNALFRPTVICSNFTRLDGNLNAASILKPFNLIDMGETYFIGEPRYGINDPDGQVVSLCMQIEAWGVGYEQSLTLLIILNRNNA